jgi:predicted DsbA family dithiol-disulfide isomerase
LQSEFEIRAQWIAFPLHPETPPEGRTLEDLFSGRNIDIPPMLAHLKQVARDLSLPFGDREMTYNSRLAQELGKWAEQMGKGDAYHAAVFRAYFADGRNIADVNILADVTTSVGLDAEEAHNMLAARTFKEAVDTDWTRAYESRVTAVPTFLMNGQTLVGAQTFNALANFMLQNNVKRRPSKH